MFIPKIGMIVRLKTSAYSGVNTGQTATITSVDLRSNMFQVNNYSSRNCCEVDCWEVVNVEQDLNLPDWF